MLPPWSRFGHRVEGEKKGVGTGWRTEERVGGREGEKDWRWMGRWLL